MVIWCPEIFEHIARQRGCRRWEVVSAVCVSVCDPQLYLSTAALHLLWQVLLQGIQIICKRKIKGPDGEKKRCGELTEVAPLKEPQLVEGGRRIFRRLKEVEGKKKGGRDNYKCSNLPSIHSQLETSPCRERKKELESEMAPQVESRIKKKHLG